MEKIEFVIEGLNTDGDWVAVDRPLSVEGDHAAHRDHVVKTLRDMQITRYSRVRLVKKVLTTSVVGEEIEV